MIEDKQKYIIIENFEKHLHYQDYSRPVIWVKVYIEMLNKENFWRLKEDERWIFVGLLLLGVITKNRILLDLDYLKTSICHPDYTKESLDNAIISLEREQFIAIKSLSKCYQDAKLLQQAETLKKEKLQKKETKLLSLSFSELYTLKGTLLDDEDLEVLRVFYKLGYICHKGEEKEFATWIATLVREFKEINFINEIKKFEEYWEAQPKKLTIHKLAFRNWLTNARKYAKD